MIMKTFDNFRKVINESDYILSEAQRYLEILLEKDSEALKQYKASKKSFQKGFGKNIKPTVVQPGLDLYKAGGPFVPDKTTFKDSGKKVPKMEPKPQFGTPKSKSKTPDKTALKKAISDVRASDKRLYDAGVGKKPSLVQQRKYTKERIKQLSRQTTLKDKLYGSTGSTEGAGGANTGTKPQKSTKTAAEFTKEINQKNKNRKEFTGNKTTKPKTTTTPPKTTTPKTPLFSRVKPKVQQRKYTKGDGKVTNSKGIGNKYRGNSPEAKALRKQAIDARMGSGVVVKDKVTMSDRVNKGFTTPKTTTPKTTKPTLPDFVKRKRVTGVTAAGKPSYSPKYAAIKDRGLGIAAKKEFARNPKSPLLQKQNLRYLKAASKQKGLMKGITRVVGSLGPKGRLAAGGIAAFLATPGGRNFAKNLAIGGGLTAAFGLANKKEKVLKKGDGLKTVGKVNVRYGLTGTSKKGQGGKIYDPKQMAQLGKVQKNFIDKYNQKAARNPFKKQIQYKPKADGTYKILDPKKK